ncbi:MAG: asparaginase [Hyphomicrobiales bacterium]
MEVTRNEMVESRHFGAAVVCDHKGNVLHGWGDIEQLMFPRSALKPLLAIDLVESGACDHYGLGDAELSLACASHQGEMMHKNLVESWLARLGLSQDYLSCGVALPDDLKTAQKVIIAGDGGCRSHHNCSGKHAGYLTNALHLKLPLKNYHSVDHAVQQRALDVLSDMAMSDVRKNPMGIDGCGLAATTMPLVDLGRAMARYANPHGMSGARSRAIARLQNAVRNEPLYAAGHATLVSDLLVATNGSVLAKTGSEGVLVASLPEPGLGIAIKIADGNARPRATALLTILEHLGCLSEAAKSALRVYMTPPVMNSRDEPVGSIRPAPEWISAMESSRTTK